MVFFLQILDTLLQISTYEIFQKCDSRPLVKVTHIHPPYCFFYSQIHNYLFQNVLFLLFCQVLTPIIRILGNLAAGPDSVEVSLHLVRHSDFPAIVTALLSTNYTSLCQVIFILKQNIFIR